MLCGGGGGWGCFFVGVFGFLVGGGFVFHFLLGVWVWGVCGCEYGGVCVVVRSILMSAFVGGKRGCRWMSVWMLLWWWGQVVFWAIRVFGVDFVGFLVTLQVRLCKVEGGL